MDTEVIASIMQHKSTMGSLENGNTNLWTAIISVCTIWDHLESDVIYNCKVSTSILNIDDTQKYTMYGGS